VTKGNSKQERIARASTKAGDYEECPSIAPRGHLSHCRRSSALRVAKN
jgi:hypothetical protein